MSTYRFVNGIAALTAAGMMFVSSMAAAAGTVYIKAPGIQGESTAGGHSGDVEALTLNFGDKVAVNVGTGAAAGRPTFTEIKFTKSTDKSSPTWFADAAQGKVLGTVSIMLVRSGMGQGGMGMTYMTITLTNAMVTGYEYAHDGTAGGTETITLNYTRIQLQYAGGASSTTGVYNLSTNSAS